MEKSKIYNLKEKRPQVLLVGNGLLRPSNNDYSWENIIKKMKKLGKKKYPNRAEKIKQFNKNNEYIKTFNSSREASRLLNISETSISNCVNGYSKTAGGFIWKR